MSALPDSLGLQAESKASILLVDDNPSNLLSLRVILENLGQNLVEARSGEEAIQRIQTEVFAAILLDVLMPGISGFETAKIIRSHERSGHTPIIFLTASDIDRSEMEQGYVLGAVDFLVKPVLPVALQAKVRGFVELFMDKQRTAHEADQLRLLIQGTTDYAIFMLDPNGNILTWNAGAERFKGYKADEIIGQHFTKFYPQEAIDRGWPDHELKVAKAEGRFEDEGWRVRKDGTQFWANVVITALRDEQGQLRGFSKVTRDLTARKQAEERLRRSEERFRLLVEGAKDYAIFLLDPSGHIASWNTGAERIKGYKSEEIIGQHFTKFYPQEAIDRGWPAHELKVAKAEGRFEDEGWRVRKDGTQFWANVVITALFDEGGNHRGFSKITRDMTERKRSEENARRLVEETAARRVTEENARLIHEQRERLHVTLTSIGDAVIATDPEGRVTMMNPVAEDLTGWKHDEATGHPLETVFNIVNEDTRIAVENPAHRALREGVIVGLANHTVLIAKDGTERPIDDSAALIRYGQQEIVGAVLVFRDISERKQSEKRLREQQQWLRVTLASIGDAVIATDTEGRVTFLNGIAQELTGWTQEDAEGQSLEAVFTILNEQTRQAVENPVKKVLRDGIIVGLGNQTVLIARDGTERPIDDSAAPIRDATGNLIGVVLTFRDVTEQRRIEWEVRQSEARKSAILETALDCIITIDHNGKVVEFNPAAEKTFGFERADVVGRELADFIIPLSLRDRHRQGMSHYLATGEGPVLGKRLELTALRADGIEIPVELAITRISTDGPPLFTAYLRDITDQNRLEQYRNLRLAVTNALIEAASVHDGASGVLRSVCEHLGWDVGFFWIINDNGECLVCRASWHRPNVTVTEFETASCARTFAKGEGLPGRVWASNKPAWILDVVHDVKFPRLAVATQHGLHSAFACPVVIGDRTLGVIEFFTQRIREADADLLETMGTVAGSVGQFIERKAAEEELRRSEQELADFFENATIGLHWVGRDGIILRANKTELDMLGYRREEYIGRPIADFHADDEVICDILQRLQAGEKLEEYPARLRCKDGAIKDVLIDSSVMWKDDIFVHSRCFTRDVTERKRVERELLDSEQRFARFMQYLPGLAWIKDVRGRYIFANDAAEKAFRTTRAELYGKTDEEVFPPETAAQFRQNDTQAMASGTGVQVIEALDQENGVRYSLVSKFPILGSDGQVALVGGMAIDITEQKRVQQTLRESEERFRGLMEQAPFSIQVFSPDGRTSRVNPAWEELWGIKFEQIEGYNILEDQQLEAKGVLQYIHEGFSGQPTRIPAIQYNPNETIPNITQHEDPRRWLSAVIYPLKDGDGQVREVVLIHDDITARKRAEDALLESEEKLRLLADTIPQLAWMASPNGDIFWYNRRWYEYTGTTPEHMEGWGWQSVHDPEVLPNVLERWKKSIVSGAPFDMVFPLKGANGEFRPFLTRVNPLRDEQGRILYWFGTNTDISEIKRMEEALRDADRRKDEFLATLAHELRNPLAPIRNSLQILKMPRVDAETAQQTRDMMERQVHHLIRLVDDLLDVSRVMKGKIELQKERIELATVVARAVETAQPLIEVQGHRLELSLPSESLLLEADPVRLAQVLSNLLTNAAKYTEANGHIWLTARREGNQAVLRVRDDGIGIAPDMLPHIFELFVQVDFASTKAQGGLGIGLTLVKNLVGMHGGIVEAQSAGLGQGCEFIVCLPLMVQGQQPKEKENGEPQLEAAWSSGLRLLVVDDNQDAALSLVRLLRLQGHKVEVAHSGPAALAMTKSYTPDMVFLDIGMPGMDGYEVARRLRQQPGLDKVVLAALTGWGQQEDRRRTTEAGFDHHLVKPMEPKALENLLVELQRRIG